MDSNANENQLTTFSQQGNVDWVALSNTQFSVSIAVLGRLAAAGIDSLTVAFGQAMCCKIPIGVHGEKVLADAMKRLVAFSSFGNLVWFGVGVRHILRDLVQTSQGSALVALCAALGEGYRADVSALVLYELAKLSGGPRELTPSFAQWKALIGVSGSVFNTSTLGIRIAHMTKLAGFMKSQKFEPSHPSDLAQVILAVGKVSNNELAQVSVQGGASCGWIAAWADFLLGLRVKVSSRLGETVYINYDQQVFDAQVAVEFMNADISSSDIWFAGRTIVVRSGKQFIKESVGDLLPFNVRVHDYLGGRLDFSTMLQDCFGPDFLELVSTNNGNELPTATKHITVTDVQPSSVFHFASVMARGFAVLARYTPMTHRFSDLSSYVACTIEWMPELKQQREMLLKVVHVLGDLEKLEAEKIESEYRQEIRALREICLCRNCEKHVDSKIGQRAGRIRRDRIYCLVGILETIFRLSFLLNGVDLESGLLPVSCGVIDIYGDLFLKREDTHSLLRPLDHLPLLRDRLTHQNHMFAKKTMADYVLLFAGARWKETFPGSEKSAMTDGKIYCYLETLRRLTDSPGQALTFYVGSGTIEYHSRYYGEVCDKSSRDSSIYHAENTSLVSDIALLNFDTCTARFEVKAMAEERADKLSFWYSISSVAGSTIVSPGRITRVIHMATEYLRTAIDPCMNPESWKWEIQGQRFVLVEGEGRVEGAKINEAHILRPRRSNMLGRLVALRFSDDEVDHTERRVALVKSDEELELFAKYWACLQQRGEMNRPRLYTLIS